MAKAEQPEWLPNLITASASTLHIYTHNPYNGQLRLEYSYPHIAGTIVSLSTLSSRSDHETDALLIGFGGHARLSVVTLDVLLQQQQEEEEEEEVSPSLTTTAQSEPPTRNLLQAICLLDFISVWNEHSCGATCQEDAIFTMLEAGGRTKNRATTVAAILGGGVAIAVTEIVAELLPNKAGGGGEEQRGNHGWFAREPYILPLVSLSTQLPHLRRSAMSELDSSHQQQQQQQSSDASSMVTGWGDIFDAIFLSAYSTAETLVLLHSAPGGTTHVGRLARENTLGPPPLYLTALSISVPHARTALLWSLPMTSDARTLHPLQNGSGCLVMGTNSITCVDAGRIQQILAVNGFARATCPAVLANDLQPNPIGLKLSLQLDGAACCFLNKRTALVVLRKCQVYILQHLANGQWCLLPMGEKLTAMGEVAHLQSLTLPSSHGLTKDDGISSYIASTSGAEESKKSMQEQGHTGLVLAGSRLGDSYLLGYALDTTQFQLASVLDESSEEGNHPTVETPETVASNDTQRVAPPSSTDVSASHRILELEEEALYAPLPTTEDARPNIVHPSDDEDGDDTDHGRSWMESQSKRHRPTSTKYSVVQCLKPLDRLINLGPIGPSCEGPMAAPPKYLNPVQTDQPVAPSNSDATSVFGANAYIFPCGFGSSGSLGLVSIPGRDDRMILAETDCLNVRSVFSLPSSKLLLLGMENTFSGTGDVFSGIKLLRLKSLMDGSMQWEELEEWTDPRDETMDSISSSSILLDACEMGTDGTFAVFLQSTEKDNPLWRIAILRWNEHMVRCDFLDEFFLSSLAPDDCLVASTPLLTYTCDNEEQYGTACRWSSGRAVLVVFTRTGMKYVVDLPVKTDKMQDVDPPIPEEDDGRVELREFYASEEIAAIDLFRASPLLVCPPDVDEKGTNISTDGLKSHETIVRNPEFDEDDIDLYGLSSAAVDASKAHESSRQPPPKKDEDSIQDETFLAIFRKSGLLEMYQVENRTGELTYCWSCYGCERGLNTIAPSSNPSPLPLPSSHLVKVEEARFFVCGPTTMEPNNRSASFYRRVCLAVVTSSGDFFLYSFQARFAGPHRMVMERELLKTVCRRSQEQSRHRTKLVKKGIITAKVVADILYSQNSLYRFENISGQDGLFAALSQPKWIVCERGKPTTLNHRTRQAAPAGGKPAPLTGFCSPLPMGGFLTVHERVGRSGSQRMTMFKGISPVFEKTGLFSGGGFYMEKLAMGVTVRQIEFLKEDGVSTGSHPLFAMLVSRELEVDQSFLNDDGMTPEEREQAEREKEEAKIQRQVEADLGGFDVELEWTSEIVRDDVFHVETSLGGAPPIHKEYYSLWIVDAANEWRVVDSYDLEEFEHGLTLEVMSLTEFQEEPGSTTATIDVADISNITFVTLGTGTNNINGEDVSAKGRVLLFEVKKPDPGRRLSSQVAHLSLTYEKEIFHGPVTSLSCLSAEGKNRLVIGAGADVNLEQWGKNGKLTQVGFFRATMQIHKIMLFKTYFLLSDAYDSLYFLVWRESDKSLTLLSKAYDSIVVYAAGFVSRGMLLEISPGRDNVG